MRSRVVNTVPDEIINNTALNDMIDKELSRNYRFELYKTIW